MLAHSAVHLLCLWSDDMGAQLYLDSVASAPSWHIRKQNLFCHCLPSLRCCFGSSPFSFLLFWLSSLHLFFSKVCSETILAAFVWGCDQMYFRKKAVCHTQLASYNLIAFKGLWINCVTSFFYSWHSYPCWPRLFRCWFGLWNQFVGFPKPNNLLSTRETGSKEAQPLCCSRIQGC